MGESVIKCHEISVFILPIQKTGKLKIGTYTGPLQHGIVYSGGERSVSLFWAHLHSELWLLCEESQHSPTKQCFRTRNVIS